MNTSATTTHDLGQLGEDAAAAFLETLGYRILAKNWRAGRIGEIDIIADDRGTTAFVEVKTRSHPGHGSPLEAVTAQKLARMQRVALKWLAIHSRSKGHRFDVVGVTARQGQRPELELLQDVGP